MDPEILTDSILSTFEVALSCVGFLFNASVIYITLRAKWLHTPCNILLAAYEFCLLFFDGQKFLEEVVLGDNEYSLKQCFWMISPFFALFSTSFILMASIAVDRFISGVYPLHYQHSNKKIFALIICAFAFLNVSFLLILAYHEVAKAPNNLTNCGITSTLQQNATYFSLIGVSCQFFSIILYAILWINVRWKTTGRNGISKRLFKSLFCIVLFSLLGFVPNTIYYAIASNLDIPNFWNPDTLIGKILLDLSDDMALISCCSNAVILFTFSGEYRRAFCTYLPFLCYLFKNNSRNSSNVNQLQNNRQIRPVSSFHQTSNFAMSTWPAGNGKNLQKDLKRISLKNNFMP